MAIYHLSMKVGSRSKGQSAQAKFNYITRTGKYSRQPDKCLYTESGNMPAWAKQDDSLYWKKADEHERSNARLFREIEFALPVELSQEQQIAAAKDFANHITKGRFPYTLAIHAGRGRNPHCHLIVSERINDGRSRTTETWFKRYPHGAKKSSEMTTKDWLKGIRKTWADTANRHLKDNGHKIEIDHRSNQARGIREPPSIHIGQTWHGLDKSNPRRLKYIERERQKSRRRRSNMNSMKPTHAPKRKKDRDHGIEIPDLKPTAQGVGVIVWMWADSGKAALIDKGDFIELATGSLAEWRRCADLAKAKGWEGIHITCDSKRSAYDAIRAHLERGIPVTKLTLDGQDIDSERLQRWVKKVAEDHNLTIPNTQDAEIEQTIEEAVEAAKAQEEYVRPSKEQIKRSLYGSMFDYSEVAEMLRKANESSDLEAVNAKFDIARILARFMFENPEGGKIALAQIIKAFPERSLAREAFLEIVTTTLAHKLDVDELAQKYVNNDLNDVEVIRSDVDEIISKYFDNINMSEEEIKNTLLTVYQITASTGTFREIREAREAAVDTGMDMGM